MPVSEWMSLHPLTVTPKTTVGTALRLLREHGIRRLPVIEEGSPVGVVRTEDLLRLTPSEATTLDRYELHDLLQRLMVARAIAPATMVKPEVSLGEAARTFLLDGTEELLVVADGRLLGIFTHSDLLRGLTAKRGEAAPMSEGEAVREYEGGA
jgi:acetoin utilization protein AcuB